MKTKFNHDDPEFRSRMVDAAIGAAFGTPPEPSDEEKIVEEARQIARRVHVLYEQQVKQTPSLRFNKKNATVFLAQAFINEFRHLDKERLLFLVAMLHTEAVLGNM